MNRTKKLNWKWAIQKGWIGSAIWDIAKPDKPTLPFNSFNVLSSLVYKRSRHVCKICWPTLHVYRYLLYSQEKVVFIKRRNGFIRAYLFTGDQVRGIIYESTLKNLMTRICMLLLPRSRCLYWKCDQTQYRFPKCLSRFQFGKNRICWSYPTIPP